MKIPRIRIEPAYSGGLLRMNPQVWPLPTVFDLDGIEEKTQVVPIIRDHDQDKKCGQTIEIDYSGGEINAIGELINVGIDADADKIAKLAERGAALQASIATGLINPDDIELVEEGQTVHVNGRDFTGPIEVVRRWKLKEISIVTVGADDEGTKVIIAKGAYDAEAPRAERKRKRMANDFLNRLKRRVGLAANATEEQVLDEVEKAVKEAEESEKEKRAEEEERAAALAAFAADELGVELEKDDELTDREKKILEAAYQRLGKAEEPPAEETDDKTAEAADEEEQAEEETDEDKAAVKTGAAAWTRTKYPAKMLGQFSRYVGSGSAGRPSAARVAEAALMTSNGTSESALKRLGYTDAEIDEASKRENRSLTLKGLLYRTGAASPGVDDVGSIGATLGTAAIRARLQGDKRYRTGAAAGELSTIDIPGVLANVMYKSLLNGLQTVEDPTDKISRVVNARDFRPQTFVNLLTSGEFADVKDNGDLENLKLSDSTYTNTAKMRGFELRIGYEAIANDDMNALQEIPKIMGRKAALRKQKIFFDALTSATGITAVSGNPALTLTGLDKASAAFRGLKDADNDPIGAKPKYLIVPPALEQTGYNLTAAANIIQGATGDNTGLTIVPQQGRYAARLEVVTSEYLGSGGPFASSWGDKKYMLLADPADMPLMILSYYQNQKAPALKTVYGDVDIEGLRFVCYWGFGVSVAETKAAVVSNPS
ncbi:MAG: hypothetical protein IJL92_08730 [Thermoguttaceae bacterium]|nr:hypothetical protein [Thermoguttaceae bacterium]